jgi:hypothetical protein
LDVAELLGELEQRELVWCSGSVPSYFLLGNWWLALQFTSRTEQPPLSLEPKKKAALWKSANWVNPTTG